CARHEDSNGPWFAYW
nr:immunoglobulin heavy chain junction region [Mus musculus]